MELIIPYNPKQFSQKYQPPKFKIDLSFRNVPEYERTKHVHRLHPYLGKFIPQLAEFFLKKYLVEVE